MKLNVQNIVPMLFGFLMLFSNQIVGQTASPDNYLDSLKIKLQKKWPDNRTINLVFHGHSVPAGYRTSGVVKTLESYPYETFKLIKEEYSFAVVNVIVTAIGGEQSKQGAGRFSKEVLSHDPAVLFIDYALNDRSIGLEKAKKAWESMIETARRNNTKVILLTPTPDLREDILDSNAKLAKHSRQIRKLAEKYNVGLVDSYAIFKGLAKKEPLDKYMAQNNHINNAGHQIVAKAIYEYFKN